MFWVSNHSLYFLKLNPTYLTIGENFIERSEKNKQSILLDSIFNCVLTKIKMLFLKVVIFT